MIRQQLLLSALALSAACQTTTQLAVSPLTKLGDTDRTWIGEDFFANRLQDWRIRGGRLECTVGAKKNPLRTAQLLTTALSSDVGDFSASVTTGAVKEGALEAEAFHGFILGGGTCPRDGGGKFVYEGCIGSDVAFPLLLAAVLILLRDAV